MKIFMPKYLHRISISRQGILNFVTAHPRLVSVIAGLGISFTFASIGRLFIHEAFALLSTTPELHTTSLVYNVPVDPIPKYEVDNVPRPEIQKVLFVSCSTCHDDNLELHELAKKLLPAHPDAFSKQATGDILSEIIITKGFRPPS
jgi:hypothetical protein